MTAAIENLKSLFLVMPADEDFPSETCRVVSAADADEAIGKYIVQVLAREDVWLEDVYTNAASGSFAESLFVQRGVPLLDEQGDWICTWQEARRIFEGNVRDLFGVHTDWADRYLHFYFENQAASWRDAMAQWGFPQEMIGYMLKQRGGWCDIVCESLDSIMRID